MKIHGHPQKTDYLDDGSDWPMPEAQGWFPVADPILAGHLHLAVKFPLYGEVTSLAPFWVPFTLKLHDFAGEIREVFGVHYKQIQWDDTGSATPPVMRTTNPGLAQWSGKILLDFSLGIQPWLGDINPLPLSGHGWGGTFFTARAYGDNGDVLETQLLMSFFALLNPEGIERPAAQLGDPGFVVSARVTVHNNTVPNPQNPDGITTLGGTQFGVMVTEANSAIPLLPFDQPWNTILNVYNYTAPKPLLNGMFRQLLDANLHGTPPNIPPNEGTLLDSAPGTSQGFVRTVTCDPAVMGSGKHRTLLNWTQTVGAENLVSVLALDTVVGPGVPPPPPPPPPSMVLVPNVVGKTQMVALASLQVAGLMGMVTLQNDPTVLATDIISQDPVAGTSVAVGMMINLVVSTGPVVPPPPPPPTVIVPNVIGKTCFEATNALMAAGLMAISAPVTSQSPAAGALVSAGSSVTIEC